MAGMEGAQGSGRKGNQTGPLKTKGGAWIYSKGAEKPLEGFKQKCSTRDLMFTIGVITYC